MSASFGGQGSGGSGPSQDFDLNIAPIIDCFTVLIAFLLVTAAFLSIGFFDAGIAAGGATAKSTQPPAVNLSIEILSDSKGYKWSLTGKESKTQTLGDLPALVDQLKKTKAKYSDLTQLTLSADNKVAYSEVVLAMDQLRKVVPSILLGGF